MRVATLTRTDEFRISGQRGGAAEGPGRYIILIYGIEWQMPLAGQPLSRAEQHARPGSMCDIRIFHLLLAGWVGGRRAM